MGIRKDGRVDHQPEHKACGGTGRGTLVERRHAVLRKAIEIYLSDLQLDTVDGIRQALSYVVPQVNGASQWVLGFQPSLPGELAGDDLNPAHLSPSDRFEDILQKRAHARNALTTAI